MLAFITNKIITLKNHQGFRRYAANTSWMMAEQLLPFSKDFPGDPQKFKFLGAPIDGILFEEDKIVIVEFKTGRSQLSSTQRRIRELVENGKVYFQEIRMTG